MIVKTFRYAGGSSLVEVLVAALILGVGLLGVATLQLKALQGSSDAQYRSQATDIAWMVADRIRANLPSVDDYGGVTADCTSPPTACAMKPTDTSAVNNCTTAQMIAHDIYEATCLSGVDALPNGTINITRATSPDPNFISRYEIEISWDTRIKEGGSYVTEKVTMSVVPGSDPGL